MLQIDELVWNDANVDHLWVSHQVTSDEVDEVIFGVDGEPVSYRVRRDGPNYTVYGRTGDGRLLYIVLEPLGNGRFRPFAARNMTARERNAYQ